MRILIAHSGVTRALARGDYRERVVECERALAAARKAGVAGPDAISLRDFRETAAGATRGCIVLERPDLLKQVVERHGAHDTTARGTAMAELDAMMGLSSQHNPGNEVPEDHWLYRFAKKHWYFGFGAYT